MTHVFKHPKYYTELRKRNKLAESRQPVVGGQQTDQAISCVMTERRLTSGRAPGQGPKHQASSVKPQAPEETSDKRQVPSNKPQA